MGTALFRQPGIGARNVLVKNPVKAPRPGLRHAPLPQPGDEVRRLVSRQSPERPAGEIHIHVDDHTLRPFALRIGASIRCRFPPRTSRRAGSGISAPITLASCDAKLRPAASLP